MKTIKLTTTTPLFLFGIALSLFGSISGMIIPLLIRKVIDLKSLLQNQISRPLFAEIIAILVISTLTSAVSNFLISRSGDQQIAKIRNQIQSHLIRLPISYFNNHISGELASRVINDASVVKNFMTVVVPSNISSIVTVLGTFCILLFLDWKLTLVILLCFPLDALITIPLGKINEKLSIHSQSSLSKLTGASSESIRNVRAVKLNTAEKYILDQFNKLVNDLYKVSVKADAIYAITNPLQSLFTFIIVLSIIIYGGVRVSTGTLSTGTLVSFLIYFFQIVGPINTLAIFYADFKQARGATAKVNSIINIPGEDYAERHQPLTNISAPLILKNISFSYKNKLILDRITMKFPMNKKIAIVGPSGSGKSTIINILTRLYNPDKGEIALGSMKASDIDLYSWRNLFGVVTQENTIITGDIYENLIFGLTYTPSMHEIFTALRVANLFEDVSHMEQGIHTAIGEQGVKLSGGQRQRLQIARAFLKQSRFLILDEATSNLDSDSEQLVSKELTKLMSGKTIIAIAHRLSTVIDADTIYFLDHHKILDAGTHIELLQRLPAYKRFVTEQLLAK